MANSWSRFFLGCLVAALAGPTLAYAMTPSAERRPGVVLGLYRPNDPRQNCCSKLIRWFGLGKPDPLLAPERQWAVFMNQAGTAKIEMLNESPTSRTSLPMACSTWPPMGSPAHSWTMMGTRFPWPP